MSLAPGFRLGPYEILAPLGAGGMGEVFRARDTKLGREVALKILPEAFAHDAERLARFEREARTLATLNHPHIAQIHGFEEASSRDGQAMVRALVMELVEGEDLSQRIARGAIPLDESAGHRAANLRCTGSRSRARHHPPGSQARQHQGARRRHCEGAGLWARESAGPASGNRQPATEVTNSPTLTAPTQFGMILGTAAYMAPEQAKGRAVDKRADIWAFGCVLYEMLTGRRAFDGEDVSEVLASVINQRPRLDRAPEGHASSAHDTARAVPHERSEATSRRYFRCAPGSRGLGVARRRR